MHRTGIRTTKGYVRWERVTRKWWFFLIILFMQILIPPYSSKGAAWENIGELTEHILDNSLMLSYPGLFPLFQLIPLAFIISIPLFRNRVSRIFSIYAGFSYLLFALGQNISLTETYGFSILTLNVVMFAFVSAFWFWEARMGMNDFSPRPRPLWKYWVVPWAALAFWCPLDPLTSLPDFSPLKLLTSGSGLTFCMMTPVYLAILTIFHPRVNLLTMRITGIIGLLIGFYNMLLNFVFAPELLWWNGTLHIPLVILSIYGLILSYKKPDGAMGVAQG